MKTSMFEIFRAVCGAVLLCAALGLPPATSARTLDEIMPPTLPTPMCDAVNVPAGNKLVRRMYAKGVQIYKWNGASWTFVAPAADLYADPGFHGKIGTHYGGPTWESNSGGKVIGSVVARCAPDPTSIAWLRLKAISTSGPGVFRKITFIQRVNTSGGLAPVTPGTAIDEVVEVPYTTEYYFYQAE
ncbi:MAG: DUF3455 domain-containing protein [Blastocatellia bacterium]